MIKFYETDWQGIKFTSFAKVSSSKLADEKFYDSFYKELFKKYSGYNELDESWRHSKDEVADWLSGIIQDEAKVLSVGCGLGYIEQKLWRCNMDRISVHVQDYATESLKWLREVLPSKNIHIPESGNMDDLDQTYDVIYLSAVDYALNDVELLKLLKSLKSRLNKNGCLILISASFQHNKLILKIKYNVKNMIAVFLESLGKNSRGQFWGWKRTKNEYCELMRDLEFDAIEDGFLVTKNQNTYWIKGTGSN